MKAIFNTKIYRALFIGLIGLSFQMMQAQEFTDKQLAAMRKEMSESGMKPQQIEAKLVQLKKQAIARKTLGDNYWMEGVRQRPVTGKAPVKSGNPTARFNDCDNYTFNDSLQPLLDWTLFHNIAPFDNIPVTAASITIADGTDEYLDDQNAFRFEILTPEEFADPYLSPPPYNPQTSVIRIGNDRVNTRRERIKRRFTLANSSDFLVYNFAMVLQDPGHANERPFYQISLYEVNGGVEDLIECSVVRYEADPERLPGFINVDPNLGVWVRPWATNVIKPADFGATGTEFAIEITAEDCGLGGHFGYGYFDVQCFTEEEMINVDSSTLCVNEPVTFSSQLDSAQNGAQWTITDGNGNFVQTYNFLEGQNNAFLTHIFQNPGTYNIELSIPYFTTTNGCDNRSRFVRKVEIRKDCPCIDCASFNLVKKEKYLVSGWVKEEDINNPGAVQYKTYTESCIEIRFIDTTPDLIGSPYKFYPTGEIIDGWQRMVGEIFVPGSTDFMTIDLRNENDNSYIVSYFDDIRIFPSKGNMKSYVYDQETQRLMAEHDENNYSSFYEYDQEGGLIRIKKETEKGIFTIQESRSTNPKRITDVQP